MEGLADETVAAETLLEPAAPAAAHRAEGDVGTDHRTDLRQDQSLPETEGEPAEDVEHQAWSAQRHQPCDDGGITQLGPEIVPGEESAQRVDVAGDLADRREIDQHESRCGDGEQDQQAAQFLREAGRHRLQFDVILDAFRDVLPGVAHLPCPCSVPPSARSPGTERTENQRTPKQSRMPRQRRLCTPYLETPRRRGRWFTGTSETL